MSRDDDALTPEQQRRVRWMIRTAAGLARLTDAEELAVLEALARGDRVSALRIKHQALTSAMARELAALIEAGAVRRFPTLQ